MVEPTWTRPHSPQSTCMAWAGLVMHLLVDAAACRPDLAQVAAQHAGAAGVALGSAGDLLADAHGREVGIPGQQFLGSAPGRDRARWHAAPASGRGRLLQLQGGGHGVPRAVQPPRDRPAGEFFDLREAADLGPQSDVHGVFLLGSAVACDAQLAEQIAEPDQPLARLRSGG